MNSLLNTYKKVAKHFVIVALLKSSIAFSQSAVFSWANSYGDIGGNADKGKSIVVDASGNVFAVGDFRGTVDFDPSPATLTLTSAGVTDIYITKTDAAGNTLWAKRVGSGYAENVSCLALDPSGNLLLTGTFTGPGAIDFDPDAGVSTLTTNGGIDVFVLKLNSSGSFVWARNMGGTSTDEGTSIATNSLGEVFTTGTFNGTADFDPSLATFNLSSAGGVDIFVTKFNSAGNFIWADRFGGTSTDVGLAITTNTNGVFFTGYFQGIADFDPSASTATLNSSGSNDAFVCMLNSNGTLNSAFNVGGSGGDVAQSIRSDASDNILITGYFNGIADFDYSAVTNTLASSGGADIFVAKYSPTLVPIWARAMGGAFGDQAYGISTDNSNNVYTTGVFKNLVDFDPSAATFTTTSNGNTDDIFIHKLDANGNFVWVEFFGGNNADISNTIVVDNSSNIYTTGSYISTVDFNPGAGTYTLAAIGGGSDAYIHKLAPCVAPPPPVNTTSNSNLSICDGQSTSLTVSGSSVSWYSTPTSTNAIATGPIYNTPLLFAGIYSYYAESSTCTLSTSRTQITVSVAICSGINENLTETQFVKIYPNPSNGLFVIETGSDYILSVNTILGTEVKKLEVRSGTSILDINDLANGIYILNLKGTKSDKQFRVIKN